MSRWVGTSQKKPPSWTSTEINLYESQDLVNWRFRSALVVARRLRHSSLQLASWSQLSLHAQSHLAAIIWQPCCRSVVFRWQQIQGYPGRLPYGHLLQPPPPFRIERPKVCELSRGAVGAAYCTCCCPGFPAHQVPAAAGVNAQPWPLALCRVDTHVPNATPM